MKTDRPFFAHLLGRHWRIPVRVSPSTREFYSICVHSGKKPNAEYASVLYLNLENQTGLHDWGMHHHSFTSRGASTGHAWDDNLPDEPRTQCDFETWVTTQIYDIIGSIANRRLSAAGRKLESGKVKSDDQWRALLESFRELDDAYSLHASSPDHAPGLSTSGFSEFKEEERCRVTLGWARCALALGETSEVKRLSERFEQVDWMRSMSFHQQLEKSNDNYKASGLPCTMMMKKSFQSLVAPLLKHDDEFWCEVMRRPMIDLASLDAENGGFSSRFYFQNWLMTLARPSFMRQWVDTLLRTRHSGYHLLIFAKQLQTEAFAGMGVELVDHAIQQEGAEVKYLEQLSALLRCSKQNERADAIDADLLLMEGADDSAD